MDKGDAKAAVQNLRDVQEKLQQIATQYDLDELEEEVQQLEQEAKELEDQGMDKAKRKSFRPDSYKTRSQQKN